MADDNNILWYVIIGIIILAAIAKPLGIFSSTPNDLQLFPTRFPLIYDYNLNKGTNLIKLNEGISLLDVYGLYYIGKGCSEKTIPKGSHGLTEEVSSSESITFNGKNYEIQYSSCEVLFYGDEQFDENKYQHYEERTIKLADSINSRNLNIYVDEKDINSIKRELKLFEQVSCTRDSHCNPIVVNGKETPTKCDLNYHSCSVSSIPISSLGTTPNNIIITKPQSADNSSIIYVIGGFIILIILWNLFRR